MSKHSKKQKRYHDEDRNNNFDINQIGNLFSNMDPNQLTGLLNNVDLSQLSSMVQNFMSGEQTENNVSFKEMDKRIEILNAMKPLVDSDKSKLIDSILQIYNITRLMKR
ncbi:hypothetical protein SAMN05428976_104121 [Clostridium sp. USBA 49]|jgi:hypothetical protein|uniref:hypothetical protein n=1 Tax=Clostridium sp. USBA 49 TaxID=1881060 RepID=UPI00099A989E|nr:hypothetical protein [Clostridium sp. USBA 49]SKA80836.1 hypothetical protein SAMN05428976_104121 [Clostridium sp. USBA 49]